MASTKTYTLSTTGVWTATALDSTGTYETSELSNSVDNLPIYSCDLSTLSGWASITAGSHILTMKAKASGYATSDASDDVTISVVKQLTAPTVSSFSSGTITFDEVANANTYGLYDGSTSIGDISIYSIDANPQYCSEVSTNPDSVATGGTVTLQFTANSGYKLTSSSITSLVGATQTSWTISTTSTEDDTGTLVLKKDSTSSNISFNVVGVSVGIAAPTEVSVNAHDVMFLNATTEADAFEIYVDNVSLGTVSVSTLADVSSVTAVDNELTVTAPDGTDAVGIFVDDVYLDAVDI